MRIESPRIASFHLETADIAAMASRIERSQEIRDRLFRPYCSPPFSLLVLQVAMTAHRGGRTTIKSLAAEKGLSPSTVSRMVYRLVERGLLTTAEDTEDKRRTIVGLTTTSESLASLYFHSVYRIFYGDKQPGHEEYIMSCEQRRDLYRPRHTLSDRDEIKTGSRRERVATF